MIDINDFEVNLSDLNGKVSDEDIYYHYLGDFEDNSWFSAPWRSDTNPSLRISYYKNRWVWTDFGEDNRPKHAINFVMRLYNITYFEALERIYKEVYLNNEPNNKSKSVIKTESTSYCKIRQEFFTFELDYWKPANITKQDLLYWDIYSGEIRHNGRVWHQSKESDPLFIYMFDKKIPIYKGYRPYAKDKHCKFYAKNVSNHIQGLDKLTGKSKILIITKSYKDVIVWSKLGYDAIAPHTENMFISPFDFYDLQLKYPIIYLNYDNDDVGVKKSIEYTNMYGINYFNIPLNTCCKDVFEFVCNSSYNELDELLKQKLKRDGIY